MGLTEDAQNWHKVTAALNDVQPGWGRIPAFSPKERTDEIVATIRQIAAERDEKRGQADAWQKVTKALDEKNPVWPSLAAVPDEAAVTAIRHMTADRDSKRSQASAWRAVCAVLDVMAPDWRAGETATVVLQQNACAAIRKLASELDDMNSGRALLKIGEAFEKAHGKRPRSIDEVANAISGPVGPLSASVQRNADNTLTISVGPVSVPKPVQAAEWAVSINDPEGSDEWREVASGAQAECGHFADDWAAKGFVAAIHDADGNVVETRAPAKRKAGGVYIMDADREEVIARLHPTHLRRLRDLLKKRVQYAVTTGDVWEVRTVSTNELVARGRGAQRLGRWASAQDGAPL